MLDGCLSCLQDQKVSWHATPFEERLEKALSDESLISQRFVYFVLAIFIVYDAILYCCNLMDSS